MGAKRMRPAFRIKDGLPDVSVGKDFPDVV